MRLTHKHKYKKDSQRFVFDMKDYRKVCQKLGQLEDIEEDLGIDLITLFKALKNGIYYKDFKDNDSIKFTKDIEEHINWKELEVPAEYTFIGLLFRDYGKT